MSDQVSFGQVSFGSQEFWQLCRRIGLLRYGPHQTRHGIPPQKILDHMVAEGDEGIVMTLLREELERLTKDNPQPVAGVCPCCHRNEFGVLHTPTRRLD